MKDHHVKERKLLNAEYIQFRFLYFRRFWVLKDLDGEGDKGMEDSGQEEVDAVRPSSVSFTGHYSLV